MSFSRRNVLALGGCLSASVLSGCTGTLLDRPRLTLNFLNFDSEPHTVDVELLRADADERSEAVVLNQRYELPTPAEAESSLVRQEPNVVESRKYVVRVHLDDAPETRGDYYFYPDCTDDDEPAEVLYIEVHAESESPERYIEFKQNLCGSDSWWY